MGSAAFSKKILSSVSCFAEDELNEAESLNILLPTVLISPLFQN